MENDKDSQLIEDHAPGQANRATDLAKRPWHCPTITHIEIKRSMFNMGLGGDGSSSHS